MRYGRGQATLLTRPPADLGRRFNLGTYKVGIRAGCKPRADVLEGELSDAIFAANFGQLVKNEAPAVYGQAALFFQNTHPTTALKRICSSVFNRLANVNETGAVLRLSTGFGGGKTHTLMALWHLANNIADTSMGADLVPPAGRPAKVRVIGVDAEGAGYPIFARHDGLEARSFAAELFYLIGGPSALKAMGSANNTAASPEIDAIKPILPDEPLLILLDELVLYMDKLTDQELGNFIGFLRALMTLVSNRPQTVLVITDPAQQPANARQTAALNQLAHTLQQQTGRTATVFEPIGTETAQVIVRRLFEGISAAAAGKASADYHALYERVADNLPGLMPKYALTIEYAERLRSCYPLHPRLLDTAENRLRVLPDYNLSRGTLRLFARLIRDLWDSGEDPEVITAGEIDWASTRMQGDLLQRLDREKFRAAVAADVQHHASELDAGPHGVHRRAATALLLESLPLEANSGLDPAEVTLAILHPDEAGNEPAEALDRLAHTCWHIYPMLSTANGYQFRYEPNILKRIEERLATIPRADALDRLKAEVQKSFTGAFARPAPWPTSPKAVRDIPDLQLALVEDEVLAKSVAQLADDTPDKQQPRMHRNAIVCVTADASALEKAITRIQRVMAAEQIEKEETASEQGKLAREQLKKLKPDLDKTARIEAARAFNKVAFADGSVLTIDERFLVPDDGSALKQVNGQEAVRKFLENRNLVYGHADALDPPRFVASVFNGAVPPANAPDARTIEALYHRFTGAPGLRLVAEPSVVRNSILRAVEQGVLVVQSSTGVAYDVKGAVEHVNGVATRKNGVKLTTLALDDKTLAALAVSETAKSWLQITGFGAERPKAGDLPLPPPPPKGTQAATATDIKDAAKLADSRALTELRLEAPTPAAMATLGAAISPLGAQAITVDIDAVGKLKDGGDARFSVNAARYNSPIRPLQTATVLFNASDPVTTFKITLVLDFGPGGRQGLGPALRTLELGLPQGVTILARFAPSVAVGT